MLFYNRRYRIYSHNSSIAMAIIFWALLDKDSKPDYWAPVSSVITSVVGFHPQI